MDAKPGLPEVAKLIGVVAWIGLIGLLIGCASERSTTMTTDQTMREERVTDPLAHIPVTPRAQKEPAPVPSPAPSAQATLPSSAAVAPQAVPVTPPAGGTPIEALGAAALLDIPFDFDRYNFRLDAKNIIEVNALRLKEQSGWRLLLEGRCDEVGTLAYNLVLGQQRADAVKHYLSSLDLPISAIETVSYGKEQPLCTEHSTACWEKNRSVRFVLK
jgi:peptidoglycan-associated lipoprotein